MTRKTQVRPGCANEIERDARRLFPKLLRDNGYFRPLERSVLSQATPSMGLFTRRNAYRRAVLVVDVCSIEAFLERGWLEGEGERHVLTDAGAAWLRRQMSGADPFREQHQLRGTVVRETPNGSRRPVVVNDGESPLGWLRRRKDRDGRALISAEQYEAGERFRSEFTRAQLTPSVTANWGAMASSRRSRRAAPGSPADISDVALASKKRFYAAIEAVGPDLAGILVDVCCHLYGLSDVEKRYGWPRRSGKVIVSIALSALARHFGLIAPAGAPGSGARQGLRHWGSDDFRPTLNQWR